MAAGVVLGSPAPCIFPCLCGGNVHREVTAPAEAAGHHPEPWSRPGGALQDSAGAPELQRADPKAQSVLVPPVPDQWELEARAVSKRKCSPGAV